MIPLYILILLPSQLATEHLNLKGSEGGTTVKALAYKSLDFLQITTR